MSDYPKRMYHPTLAPPNNETVTLHVDQEAVLVESGWKPAPDPVVRPGYAAEPVRYVQDDDGLWAPEEPEPDPEPAKPKRAAKTSKPSGDEDTDDT